MTPVGLDVRALLSGVRRVLRRDTAVAVGLSAASAIPAALLIAWALALVRPWSRPGFGPLLLDLLIVAAAGAGAWLAVRRWIGALSEDAVAADAERSAGMREGTVRGVLELSRQVPEGTSQGLARRAEGEIARGLAGLSPGLIARSLRERTALRRRRAAVSLGVLSAAALLLGFAAPEHSRAAWAPLANPVRNLASPPLSPLVVSPGHAEVARGSDLAVHVRAEGREAITLRWRMQGDVPRVAVGRVIGDSVTLTIPRIDAPVQYWIEAPDGARSARFGITPTDPLLIADLAVDVVFPAHVRRPTEHYRGDVPPLEVPEGTQIVVSGSATRPLASVGLFGAAPEAALALQIDRDGFSGAFVPRNSGLYAWRIRAASGAEAAVVPPPLEIVVVRDAPPAVDITFPATDTVLDATLRQAIVADARDDHGLADAVLVSWRVDRSGRSETPQEQPIGITSDERVMIRALLDASSRSLVPGDTLKFFIRVSDTSPARQSAESRTIALRLPGLAELREQTNERAEQLSAEADQLARAAAELQQNTRDLERRTAAANARRQADGQRSGRDGGSSRMDFQEAAPSRQVLERQEELLARMEEMRENLRELERAMERSGLRDAELQQRLDEMRRMMDEMLTPEMREQLEQLRAALDELDPEALQQALEQMAQQQEQMREQLEQAAETMQRAAAEQQMNNLAQEARELATRQQALAASMAETPPTAAQARAQEELANRTEELAREMSAIQQKLQEQGEEETASATAQAQQSAGAAANDMREAANDARRQAGANAAEKGERAAEQLEQAAESLDQARESMADSWKQQTQRSVEQATRDALSLAERQQQLLDRMKQAQQGEQGDQQQSGQEQSGQQQGGQQQGGQQQGGQQQGGQQQGGQQQGGQQQGGQQQGGQQQGGQQQGGQQQGGQQQGGQQQGGQQGGGQMPGQSQQAGGGGGDTQSMRSEQSALQQGLQQLGRNLQEGGENAMNREVGSSLARANLGMQQTLDELQRGRMPLEQAQQSVDALNRLALSLLNNAQSKPGEGGEGAEAMQQMADIARQQGALNGRTNALSPMDVTQNALSQQLNRMSAEQMEIARRLGELNRGGSEGLTGDIDALAREAEELARQMQGGRMPPEALARQQRLFHRLLDAGRTLEKDEIDEERSAERAPRLDVRAVEALDPQLFHDGTRFRAPSAEELQTLPPAYRRLILDYFERLNRPLPPLPPAPSR
jgi:hypothetical protein